MKPRRWWHCTQEWKGRVWTSQMRPPFFAGSTEPRTPRLCVSSWLAGALAAKWWGAEGDIYCYKSEPRRTVTPHDVWDACITGEKWIVAPTRLELICVLPAVAMAWRQLAKISMLKVGGLGAFERANELDTMCQIVAAIAPEHVSKGCENHAAFCLRVLRPKHEAIIQELELEREIWSGAFDETVEAI